MFSSVELGAAVKASLAHCVSLTRVKDQAILARGVNMLIRDACFLCIMIVLV